MANKLKMNIGLKITLLIISQVIVAVFVISTIAFFFHQKEIQKRYQESLEVMTNLKAQEIGSFFEKVKSTLEFSTQLQVVRDKLTREEITLPLAPEPDLTLPPQGEPTPVVGRQDSLALNLNRGDSLREALESLIQKPDPALLGQSENLEDLSNELLNNFEIINIYLTDRQGNLLFIKGANESRNLKGQNFSVIDQDANTITVGRDSIYFSNVIFDNDTTIINAANTKYIKHMLVSAPVKNQRDELLGVLSFDVDLSYIYHISADTTGLARTGEIRLTKYLGNRILFLNPKREQFFGDFINTRNLPIMKERGRAFSESARGEVGQGMSLDENGKAILAAWRPVPVVDWGITIQMDRDEVFSSVNYLFWYLGLGALGVVGISLLLGIVFSKVLVRPLKKLREVINLLAQGILPEKVASTSNDEIGEMTDKLNDLAEKTKQTANFANHIGRGEFETYFQPLSEQDTLGQSLLAMRDSIQESAERDDERNWIVTGMAEIGDILPSITTIGGLGELVCEYITNKIGAVQGAFYTVNDDDKENPIIEMNASYAYNKKKYLQAEFKFAEGLIGQAAVEQDTIVRTEIPEDYMTISSGILGDRKPKCILITPLITNERVYGVLEFAGFEKFGHREIDFVKEISEIIARTVFNIKVKENTERLLRESQKMGSELRVQQEVLRQNAEEMEATQEELQRTNKELENQIREVQRATDRTRLLLENASEVITIYEADATIRYISPSVEKILGYTQEEMNGIRDIAYVHPDGVEAYEQMFKDLVDKPDEKVTIEFSYQTKSGERIWLEATGTNLLSDPAIQGIVLNMRDITERRAAEREQRLRGQMQALSENSPDLITRISREGTVFYINPTIETYTGKNKEKYLQKHIKEIDLAKDILDSWNDIIKDVITKNQKINLDMDFPSIMGERVMQVNAIPEYNDQNTLESVLIVSHDITERKIIELEISQKNRKITESINYAKRIQEAILPDTNYIRQFLKDSFILYKPRDVVSGDFPWFLQKGDDIFIAAVDCTGHGVPGALISLIGYFLLNNIVNVLEASNPGDILDLLDEEVTKTLKQDESDASTKDGMDISLCKINTKKRQIEYAGAHRPLYYLTDEELHEIKGNKFPIGGAQYKNRGRFTNTVINYRDGDSIYLFSDGFPDQFGGPKNKKFSPRRIREIIRGNSSLDLSEINFILDEEFETWRGNNKQTDDVLMIGIKL